MNTNTFQIPSTPNPPPPNQFQIPEVENSMKNMNVKHKQELKELFLNPKEHLAAYELNDENLQIFRRLRKCFSDIRKLVQILIQSMMTSKMTRTKKEVPCSFPT